MFTVLVQVGNYYYIVRRHCWRAGQFDQLVCDIMQLLDKYARHLNLKRKRNEGEVSLTLNAKRPDLCVLVRSALLFKGEDKSEEGQIDQAVAELKQKMRRWSQSYHGQASLSLCIPVICMILPLGHVELMSLNQTCTGSSCLLCL